jgi:hypothetical protein
MIRTTVLRALVLAAAFAAALTPAPTAKSMNDFARLIAAGEIYPSFAFSFKPLTVFVHHPPMPKCVIAIG